MGSMVELMVTSKRAYTKGDFPGLLPVPRPCYEPLPSHTSTGDPPTLAGSLGSVFCGVILSSGSWCAQDFVCAFQAWSLCSPQSCVRPSRSDSLGILRPFCQIPMLGSLMWGSELSQQWENFFSIIVLQFPGHLPDRYGI